MNEQALSPGAREVIEGVVDAVRAGDDVRIDRLLEQLVRIGSPDVLYELRRQLANGSESP
ncbi:hypothetical protein C0216_31060 (plasmid) [Streptomyces globosus]|uniref:Uncharacterized protein n=1 Tax=Streptomyces globosus TaxID=68209 RepID=A0A344UAL8_9ACTN|nr:hypothetical protein [Streptomyces globosus]AXE27939.1 hypothetical protein C0216_31060 [Streptomyces globosus]